MLGWAASQKSYNKDNRQRPVQTISRSLLARAQSKTRGVRAGLAFLRSPPFVGDGMSSEVSCTTGPPTWPTQFVLVQRKIPDGERHAETICTIIFGISHSC